MYNKYKHKVFFVCCDFKIELLKSKDHSNPAEFLNVMIRLSLYPLIVKPSRITNDGSKFIDNIIINDTEGKSNSGLFMMDIKCHLPVSVL